MREADRIAGILGDWYARRAEGEALAPDDVIARHPDLAEPLRARFSALGLLVHVLLPPEPPRIEIGDFRILREIGRGGMGVVYEAEQISMKRRVALKVLALAITTAPLAVKRFQREAQAAGKLHHTNIVPIHAMGQHAGYWYYAMELVQGRPLSDVIAELRAATRPTETALARAAVDAPADLSPGTRTGTRAYFVRVAEMFAGVGEALHLAHHEGVVHRDIKPSNLLLDADGTLKIVDFGLARIAEEGPSLTIPGDLLGTPAYMSPEQVGARGPGIDHRTDVYSLGATLYEVLTLRPPFRGNDLPSICTQIERRDPVAPRRLERRIPRDLETIALKAMEKDRARRYASAGDFARDLRRFAEGAAIAARRVGIAGRAWRAVKRRKAHSALVAGLALAALAGSLLAWRAHEATERVRELEYAQLCSGVGLHDKKGQRRFERAIALAPERPEAYFLRALRSGPVPGRLDDVEKARERGLSVRTYHLARAWLFDLERDLARAEEERRLAEIHEATAAIDRYFEARLRATVGEREMALALLDAALEAPRRGALHYLALRARGELHREMKDPRQALVDLAGALALTGGADLGLRVQVASLWRALGDATEAERLFLGILEDLRANGNAADWDALCGACRGVGEHGWREKASSEGLERYPDDVDLLVERALACARSGEYRRQAELARKVLARPGDHHTAHEVLGDALHKLGELKEAAAELGRAIALMENCPIAHDALGLVLLDLREAAEARACFDRALERMPADADLWRHRGRALRALGLWPEAEADCRRALELDPKSAAATTEMGLVLMDQEGGHAKALPWFDRAIDLGATEAMYNRGLCLAGTGENEKAVEAFRRCVAIDPKDAAAWRQMALAYAGLRKPDEVLRCLREAVAANDKHVDSLWDLGHVLMRMGKKDEAREWQRRAAEAVEPNDPVAQNDFGWRLYDWQHRPADGLPFFERAEELDGTVFSYPYNRALALFALRRYDEAADAFGRALAIDAKRPRARWLRAFCLGELQRFEEALEDQREARRLIEGDAAELVRGTRWPRGMALAASWAETAMLHAFLGDFEEAALALERVGETDFHEMTFPKFHALALMGRYELALEPAEALLKEHQAEYKVRCLRALGKADEAVTLARASLPNAHDKDCVGFAYVCAVAGERERALELLRDYEFPWHPWDLLEAARVQCVLGDREAALDWLARAVEKGLRLPANMPPDPDFAPLAGDPRYRDLLGRAHCR